MANQNPSLSRRALLAGVTASASLFPLLAKKKVTVALELYSLRDRMQNDLMGVLSDVAKMGYEGVEFYSPYMSWTPDYVKQVRSKLDELKLRCVSTHNSASSFSPENLQKAIDYNGILGSKLIVMASAGGVKTLDGWKGVAEKLQSGADKMKSSGMTSGFHNHRTEFELLEGTRPIEVLAKNTSKEVVLQLDIGTCVHAGVNPVDWIKANKGRIRSIHCKDWSSKPDLGYKAIFGEGDANWKEIFQAAEKWGGVETYLIEQEGSRFSSTETAQKCLENFRKMRS